jgi:hypothetical protein
MKTTNANGLAEVLLFSNGEVVTISKSRKTQYIGDNVKIEVIYQDGSTGFEHIEDLEITPSELENLGFDLTV